MTRSGASLDLYLLHSLNTRYPGLRASGYLDPGSPRTLRLALRFGDPTRRSKRKDA